MSGGEDSPSKNLPSLEELERKFVQSGEKDRLRDLVIARLVETGWKNQVQDQCRALISEKGVENVAVDDLIQQVTSQARRSVPADVKQELLEHIRSFLEKETGMGIA